MVKVYYQIISFLCFHGLRYLDARIYGTDEEDVGKDDEDTDVDSQHYRGAARNKTLSYREIFRVLSQPTCLVFVKLLLATKQTKPNNRCMFSAIIQKSY